MSAPAESGVRTPASAASDGTTKTENARFPEKATTDESCRICRTGATYSGAPVMASDQAHLFSAPIAHEDGEDDHEERQDGGNHTKLDLRGERVAGRSVDRTCRG